MIQVNLKTAFYEFEWVIRVMKSAETKHQLDVVYKCFHLWEQKHISKNITKIELHIDPINEKVKSSSINSFQNINFLDYLSINCFLNKSKIDFYLRSKLDQVSIYQTAVLTGQVIVRHGEPLTNNIRFLINRYFYCLNR